MKGYRISLYLTAALLLFLTPAFSAKRELVQILQQVNNLQQQMQTLQQTVDRQGAVMKTLIEQTTDTVRAMQTGMADLRVLTQKNLAGNSAKIEEIATQIEILNASLEEAKARLSRLSDQVIQTQNILQTLNTPSAGAGLPVPGVGPRPAAGAHVPAAQTLYQSAYRDYISGQWQLAVQEFQEYLHYYADTDLAANAQFYVGESFYNQGNFRQAVDEYNKALERYPSGSMLPAAQLKKGYALLELKRKQAGVRELRNLIARYPKSNESMRARERLQKLGLSARSRGGL